MRSSSTGAVLVELQRPFRHAVNQRVKKRGRSLSLERQHTRRHFIEHDPEGKQVGARVQRLAQRLLRRHIRKRSQRRSRTIEFFRRLRVAPERVAAEAGFVTHRQLRQAKIQDLGVAALGDENICRLDIAVNNAMGVSGVESIGNLDRQVQQLGQGQAALADALPERRSVEKLHRDEAPALRLTHFVDHANVGMIERGSRPRFPAEPFQHRRVLRDQLRQKLERDHPPQLGVFGLVNHTHPAAAQLFDDPVMRESMADHPGLNLM